MDSRYKETVSVAEQAAQWLITMESPSQEERAAFWKWLEASPLHVRELLLAAKVQQRLRGFDSNRQFDVEASVLRARANIPSIGDAANESLEPAKIERSRRSRLYGVAAGLALLVIAFAGGVALWNGRETYSTQLGEQLVFQLEDGSVVYLNTSSRMKVRFSDESRDIYLPRGQALFEVEHDARRPFRVHTETSVVEAVGTQFDVRVLGHKTIVSVVEGAVRVLTPNIEAPPEGTIHVSVPARLQAGEGATVDAEGGIKITPKVNVAAVSAWKQQRLIFTGESLQWIADEFNRYNRAPRLTIEGEALRSRRFNGVFNAHSPESLLEYLQQDPSIAIERRDDEIVIRETTASAGQQ